MADWPSGAGENKNLSLPGNRTVFDQSDRSFCLLKQSTLKISYEFCGTKTE
jgi:hypothetical protein